ncbi:hypothetical protein BB560_003427 [Smittium megazygosporum]|uniref:Uncharacterized protein n=1 Tax=Smittium megazygosporum TaxID=133381 RepID=A0A2T9ZC05_9FUNG|nr:hypothetical protein BB560_003427 [Smittium megazygosporum]
MNSFATFSDTFAFFLKYVSPYFVLLLLLIFLKRSFVPVPTGNIVLEDTASTSQFDNEVESQAQARTYSHLTPERSYVHNNRLSNDSYLGSISDNQPDYPHESSRVFIFSPSPSDSE